VSDHMQIMNEEAHWNVPFCRAAQDWEVEVVVTFYAKLYETRRHARGVDCIWWIPSKRKLFEVRSYFEVLNSSTERDDEGSCLFPWKSI
jgi:hypothetical protein